MKELDSANAVREREAYVCVGHINDLGRLFFGDHGQDRSHAGDLVGFIDHLHEPFHDAFVDVVAALEVCGIFHDAFVVR